MREEEPAQKVVKVTGFWTWLVKLDRDGDRGLANIVNPWLVFHILLGLGFAIAATSSPADIARSVALPGAAILIGLAFGWAGRSASLLQDKEFSKFLIQNAPNVEGYVYAFQLAILTTLIFIAVAVVILAGGLGLSLGSSWLNATADRWLLFSLGSVAVRECWGVIYFVNKLTIQFYRVREQQLHTSD